MFLCVKVPAIQIFPQIGPICALNFFKTGKLLDKRGPDTLLSNHVAPFYGGNLLTRFAPRGTTATRTAGSTAERGEIHIIDCVRSATFMSWLLNSQLVTS